MPHTINLDGCRSEPLGSYLQGLGVWRAVVRLLDPDARAHWQNGRLTLSTDAARDELPALLLARFTPISIVSPWNSGSGFAGNGKSAEAERALATVRESDDPRLTRLHAAVRAGDEVVERGRALGWGGKGEDLWDKTHKADVVRLCRNVLPDDALPWLDAAVVLGQDERGEEDLTYSRLLGTGGNFGRQDLQATYLHRTLTVLVDRRAATSSPGWLRSVLYGDESTPYLRESVGQFDPGRAGGIQSSPSEKADDKGFANPWSFLFTIEGALLFASAATRRQGALNARASVPFLVRASPVGFGSEAAEENSLGEVWTPEWDRPATLAEVKHLISEGRAEWRGRPARTGLDFVRAVSTLGVDRGISRFTRSVFVERLGQSPLAVPAGVIDVRERGRARLLQGIDEWVERVRRASPPATVSTGLRRVDQAMYEVARTGTAPALRDLLVAIGELHGSVSRSAAVRGRVRPLGLHDPAHWVSALELDNPELRTAAALASGLDATQASGLRHLLTPVQKVGAAVTWTESGPPVQGGDALRSVADAHRRRTLAGAVPDPVDDPAQETAVPAVRGSFIAFRTGRIVPLIDVVAMATGWGFRDELFGAYLQGLLLFDWSELGAGDLRYGDRIAWPALVPPPLALLLPFFASQELRLRLHEDDPAEVPLALRPGSDWLALLRAGAVDRVLDDAVSRLRIAGVRQLIHPPRHQDIDGERLAAALLLRVTTGDRIHALRSVAALPSPSPSTTEGVPA